MIGYAPNKINGLFFYQDVFPRDKMRHNSSQGCFKEIVQPNQCVMKKVFTQSIA
eukprot:c14923_g1_i1 orf=125-286(-)